MKEESWGAKVDQFWEIYMWENLVFDSLIYVIGLDWIIAIK